MKQNHREALEKAKQHNKPVFLSGDSLNVSFQTTIIEINEDTVLLENKVLPKFIKSFLTSKQFNIQLETIKFQTNKITSDGVNILFKIEKDLIVDETREAERFTFTSEEQVICECLNPFDNETKISKTVLDMSSTGVSIKSTIDSKLFEPDTEIPELKILIDGQTYTKTNGVVVYKRQMYDLKSRLKYQIGIKLAPKEGNHVPGPE